MYMTLPSQTGSNTSSTITATEIKPNHELTKVQALLRNKLSSEEYDKAWQELRHTGRDLDRLYEDCRSSAFEFKEKYDAIKKKESLNEALCELYYNALSGKKKHEEDRDIYFKNDKDLTEMKENFIEETQELAFSNSKYIDYNQRFSIRREEFICKVLNDVNKVAEDNNRLRSDRDRLNKELNEARKSNFSLREELNELNGTNEKLQTNCLLLEQKRDQMKKQAEWMLRQNNKLKDTNGRLEGELSQINGQLQGLKKEYDDQEKREEDLLSTNSSLNARCIQLEQVVKGLQTEIKQFRKEMEEQQHIWEKEKEKIAKEMEMTRKRMERARQNNHNTLLKNQQLRERLSSATHRTDVVTKDKLKAVLKEHKTRQTNAELATHQLELINEVLELKNDFFRDQSRIKTGAKLNRRLEKNIELLRQRMQMLREDPTAVESLDDAQKHRELLRQKIESQKRFVRSNSFMRPTTSIITKVI